MTRGRKREKTYTGYNGAATDALRALDMLKRTPAGQEGSVTPPSVEAMRRTVLAQICPWCGSGPYRIVASHINRAHGVDKAELRELLGVTKNTSICDPDLHARLQQQRKGVRPTGFTGAIGKSKRTFSRAGLEVQRAKLEAARSPEQSRAAAKAAQASTLAANAEKHAEIERLWRETRMTFAAIGEAVGMHPRSVPGVLRRRGFDLPDGRAVRHQRDGRIKSWATANAAYRAQAARRRDALLDEFTALGGSFEAAALLADRYAVTPKSMRGRLRKAGATVPDGRKHGA